MTIEFFHECQPPTATAQHRRHNRNGATYQPADARKASAMFQAIFECHAPAVPMRGPLKVGIGWTYRGPVKMAGKAVSAKATRPDLDNLAKLVLDAATKAGYWKDDAQVADLQLRKFEGGDIQGIAFCAVEMDGG